MDVTDEEVHVPAGTDLGIRRRLDSAAGDPGDGGAFAPQDETSTRYCMVTINSTSGGLSPPTSRPGWEHPPPSSSA